MSGADPVRDMVHDLRNRLGAIASAASAIRKSQYEKEFSEEMIEIIRSNVDRVIETINGFASREGERT